MHYRIYREQVKLVDFSFDEVDTGTGTGTQEELYTNLSGVETEG